MKILNHIYVKNQKGINLRSSPITQFKDIIIQNTSDFDVHDKCYKNAYQIYTCNGVKYMWNFTKGMLTPINCNNFYEFLLFAPRHRLEDEYGRLLNITKIHEEYGPQNGFKYEYIFTITGYKDFAYIMDFKNDRLIKFYFDINRDLYWEKDLTSHGDLIDQLKFILGDDEFNKMRSNFQYQEEPNYKLIAQNDIFVKINKNQLKNNEDNDEVEGFTIIDKNPYIKYLSKENKRFFGYGFLSGLIFTIISCITFFLFK